MFTRRHYEFVAREFGRALARTTDISHRNALNLMIGHLSHSFKVDNPKFDKEKFYEFVDKVEEEERRLKLLALLDEGVL